MKQRTSKTLVCSVTLGILLATCPVLAAVSPEVAARLGRDITPVGAEREGNAERTIPPWTGGMTTVTAGYTPGDHHPDPFAADQVLFTITAANAEQYREHLSPGQLALLKQYPSYKIPVYPTHRSASYPVQIYQATLANATRATLAPDTDALSGAIRGFPFPIPHSGREVIWNHLLRYRGHQMAWTSVEVTTTTQGHYALTKVDQQALLPYFTPGATPESLSNILLYYSRIIRKPGRQSWASVPSPRDSESGG